MSCKTHKGYSIIILRLHWRSLWASLQYYCNTQHTVHVHMFRDTALQSFFISQVSFHLASLLLMGLVSVWRWAYHHWLNGFGTPQWFYWLTNNPENESGDFEREATSSRWSPIQVCFTKKLHVCHLWNILDVLHLPANKDPFMYIFRKCLKIDFDFLQNIY